MKQKIIMESIGLCPCGQPIFASISPPAVGHKPPECDKFLELTPDEFVTYVRKSREKNENHRY